MIIVTPRGADNPQLILRCEVVEQRAETAQPVVAVMNYGRCRGHQSEIASVPVDTAVPCEFLGVIAHAEFIVGLIEIAVTRH